MSRPLERRLVRLEAAAVAGIDMPMIFVRFTSPDGTETPAAIAVVDGRVCYREPGEVQEAFRERVEAEARGVQSR